MTKQADGTDISNKTLLDQLKDLFAKSLPSQKDKNKGTVPEIPEELVTQISGFEERLNGLEQTNEDLTGQVGNLTADLQTRTGELTTANTTIKELETQLTQAKGQSTKIKGPAGIEDREDPNVSEEQKSLNKDLISLRGELTVVHPE